MIVLRGIRKIYELGDEEVRALDGVAVFTSERGSCSARSGSAREVVSPTPG